MALTVALPRDATLGAPRPGGGADPVPFVHGARAGDYEGATIAPRGTRIVVSVEGSPRPTPSATPFPVPPDLLTATMIRGAQLNSAVPVQASPAFAPSASGDRLANQAVAPWGAVMYARAGADYCDAQVVIEADGTRTAAALERHVRLFVLASIEDIGFASPSDLQVTLARVDVPANVPFNPRVDVLPSVTATIAAGVTEGFTNVGQGVGGAVGSAVSGAFSALFAKVWPLLLFVVAALVFYVWFARSVKP